MTNTKMPTKEQSDARSAAVDEGYNHALSGGMRINPYSRSDDVWADWFAGYDCAVDVEERA